MKFGLEQHIIDRLIAVFEQHSKVDKALVFGSRAKGNYRPDSDIDIAIKGQDLNTDDIIAMSVAFEEKGITYKIDLINYDNINEPALKDHIDRVGIELYSRWKEIQLRSICSDISYGYTASADFENVGPKFLRITDITNGNVNWETVPFCKISAKDNQKYKLGIGDIVIARTGATTGYNTIIKKEVDAVFASYLIRFQIDKKKANPFFIGYILQSNNFQDYVDAIAGGSAQPGANAQQFADFEFLLPPIQEQTVIANILTSLDDKIDLLHRQNKTLEQLAETLFRQSFVEEAEESWEVETLGKVFDIGIGRTPPRKEQQWFTLNPNDIKWVSIKDMGTSGIYLDTVSEYLTQEAVEKYSVPIIPENTVILSFKMTIGRLAISTERMVSNEAIAHFKQKRGSFLFPEFLYLFLKTYSWVELGSTSSIVESINSQMIKEIEMIIPNKEKLIAFKEMIIPTFDKIKSNQKQIRTLTQTRDNLLPKLMSGEIRLNLDLLD